jgi:carbon monoxide dehydrogenase subunit G
MDMTGDYVIAAPRQHVWDALNDPDVLKQCIPGCQTVEKTSPASFSAVVVAKVGPVKAKFTGEVTLSDLNPPNSYKISGQGKGGAAGFAKGGAEVSLKDAEGGGTALNYVVSAQVGGKLAQIGSRLIDSTSKKMAGEFFKTFGLIVEASANPPNVDTNDSLSAPLHGEITMAPDKHVDENVYPGTHWSVWLVGLIAALALVHFLANMQ